MAMAEALPLPQQQQHEDEISQQARPTPLSAGSVSKKRIQRRVLADVTNDASGIKPQLDEATAREEDTLRSQVKSLLQKVETDIHRTPNLRTLSHINGFLSSPSRLAAPTPWKTPATTLASPSSPRRILLKGKSLPVYADRAISPTAKTNTQIIPNSPCAFNTESATAPATLATSSSKTNTQIIPNSPCAFNTESTTAPATLATSSSNPSDLFMSANVALLSPATDQLLTPVSSLSELTNKGTASSEREGHGSGLEEVIYAEEGQEHTNDVLENPVTRALLFGTPEKHSPVEITMSPLSSAALSEESGPVSQVARESHTDESSDWCVLVAFSPPSDASDRVGFGGQVAKYKARRSQARAASRSPRKSLELYPTSVDSCMQDDAVDEKTRPINCTQSKYRSGGDADECDTEVDDSESIHAYEESVEEDDNYRELCRDLEEMTVGGDGARRSGLPEFKGKRTCFIYNSDDEIEEELILSNSKAGNTSPNVLHLRGLPTPKGKHRRFPDEDSE